MYQYLVKKQRIFITADKLPDLIESKSGLKNNARKQKILMKHQRIQNKLLTKEGPDGLFTAGDYEIVKGGKSINF